MLSEDKLYCIDLTMIYECAKMLLVAGPFMVSGAVWGCDLSHTFTHRLTCFPTHWPHGWHTCSSILPQSLKAGRQLCSSSSSVTQQDSNMDNWQGSQYKTWSRHKLQVAALIYTSMEPLSKLCSGGKNSFSVLVKCQFCSFYAFKYMFSIQWSCCLLNICGYSYTLITLSLILLLYIPS